MQQITQSQSSKDHQNPRFESYSNKATKKNPKKKLIECVIYYVKEMKTQMIKSNKTKRGLRITID